jgi:hypothetical protein
MLPHRVPAVGGKASSRPTNTTAAANAMEPAFSAALKASPKFAPWANADTSVTALATAAAMRAATINPKIAPVGSVPLRGSHGPYG